MEGKISAATLIIGGLALWAVAIVWTITLMRAAKDERLPPDEIEMK